MKPTIILTMNGWLLLVVITIFWPARCFSQELSQSEVINWASRLGATLYSAANDATQADAILQKYEGEASVERFDPDEELDRMAKKTAQYLDVRKRIAEEARLSLQAKPLPANVSEDVNNKDSADFIRYIDAAEGSDWAVVEKFPVSDTEEVNATTILHFRPNPNFYNLSVNWTDSAVHVPVPVYKREEELLGKIQWSNIDDIYRGNKRTYRDLGYQFFCSEAGFMRFLPARRWNEGNSVDLFDCRTTPGYIAAGAGSKNILILLDMSGSMLGQRMEIAKQTIEVIMETLSENDFFNILIFNDKADYLSACYNKTMVQASLRNRKYLRNLLNKQNESNMAMFEKGLAEAFGLLLNLNVTANWTTKKELPEDFVLDDHAIVFDSNSIMLIDEEYKRLVTNANDKVGCNSAIMLITDGAPSTYEEIFDLYNPQKKIRFFSFLIGNEATDFMEVRWMACYNNGFMVHISNLADVQSKVQNYMKVMSRSVSLREGIENDRDSYAWTSVFFDKLLYNYEETPGVPRQKPPPSAPEGAILPRPDSMLLTTVVAFPVIKERDGYNQVAGVAGVSVPMVELQQMAPSYRLGLNAYSFMVDNNGYVMFHPQLRPLIGSTPKPNYNSMDIMEMEPLQDQELKLLYLQFKASTERRLECKLDGAQEVGSPDPGGLWPIGKVGYEDKLTYYWEAMECFSRSNQSDLIQEHTKNLPLNNGTSTVSVTLEYDSELRTLMVDGKSSEGKTIMASIFLALEEDGVIKRVYRQENKYYTRGIEGSLFSLGLAVPLTGMYRAKSSSPVDYGSVVAEGDDGWFSGTNWRLHPIWRYCMLNDSDGDKTREEAFVEYARQMQGNKSLPELCKDRKTLVDRLLFDARMTSFVSSKWIPQHVLDAEYGIHLVFFVSESGLTRYANVNLDSVGIRYTAVDPEEATKTTTTTPPPPDDGNATMTEEELLEEDLMEDPEEKPIPQPDYMHFIQNRLKGPEEIFYKRAMRFTDNDTVVFDLNMKTQVYKRESGVSVYGRNETISLLVTAMRALTLKDGPKRAPLGVVGLEMLYDKFAGLVSQASNGACTDANMRCFLLDEHGYVVYVSHENNSYSECMGQMPRAGCHKPSDPESGTRAGPWENRFFCRLGQFFGSLCAAEQHVMDGLIKKEVYQKVTYVDYQALCSEEKMDGSFASRLLSPLYTLTRLLEWAWREIAMLIAEYSVWSLLSGFLMPVKGFTEVFADANEGLPCDKASYFYILNKEKVGELEDGALFGTVCSSGCVIRPQVALVPRTNLLLVGLKMASFIDCEMAQCNRDNEATKQVQFGFVQVSNASDKIPRDSTKCKSELRHRRTPGSCHWVNESEVIEYGNADPAVQYWGNRVLAHFRKYNCETETLSLRRVME